jgi:hypothetical protein
VTFADAAVTPPPPPPPPPATPAACADGGDNDGDGLVDARDPGCILGGVYQPQKDSEANIAPLAQCAKGALQLTTSTAATAGRSCAESPGPTTSARGCHS